MTDAPPPNPDAPEAIRARRQSDRGRVMAIHLERGRRDGLRSHRSIKCGEYANHADRVGGCSNDGSSCICECHDPKPSEADHV